MKFQTLIAIFLVLACQLTLAVEIVGLSECKDYESDQIAFGKPLVKVEPFWPRRTKKNVDEVCAIVSYRLELRNGLLLPADLVVEMLSDERVDAFGPIAEGVVSKYAFHPTNGMHTADEPRYLSRLRFFKNGRVKRRLEEQEASGSK